MRRGVDPKGRNNQRAEVAHADRPASVEAPWMIGSKVVAE